MDDERTWRYDEFRQIGTDYGSETEVDIYEARHATFRNSEEENSRVLDMLEVGNSDVLIDFGAGTGAFAIQAAPRCARVHAVDVSETMLEHARSKAVEAGVTNIEFHHAGFLSYMHEDSPADALVTTFALHHLPDFWKGVALKRLNSMLKPGGQLYIHDVILEEHNAISNIQSLIDSLSRAGGKMLREDTERHFRLEYSTYDWVMDGLLSRAGFTVKSRKIEDGVLGTYLCGKG